MSSVIGRVVRGIGAGLGLHHPLRRLRRGRLLVVCYHGLRADDAPDRHWLLLPESAFRAQVAFLAAHYDCLPVDDAVARLRAGTLDRPTACVTFDDGYASNLHLGLPTLREFAVPATIYLATGLIGTGGTIWTVALEQAFAHATAPSVDLGAVGGTRVALGPSAERARVARETVERLKLRPVAERRARAAALVEALAPAPHPPAPPALALLDWAGVAALADSGLVTFGGHTVDHEIVSRLDDAALEAEIGESVEEVRRRASHATSRTFAYPNGRPVDFDARAAAVLARHGCVASFATIEGLCAPDSPPFALPRLVVGAGDVDPAWFAMRAAGV